MKTAADKRPERAVTVSDGTVRLNINPRKAGRPARLDHLRVEVEDIRRTCEPPREQARAISHLVLRTLHADEVAEFYVDLFGFERLDRKAGDPNHYLSDGRITLLLMPWSILDYEGGGIARPGPDHIGFRVES